MKKITYEAIASTQTEARSQLALIEAPYVIMARTQTDGYGKFGRSWASYRENFAATFVVQLLVADRELYKAPMLVAIKLCSLLSNLTNSKQLFTIKWPNDILLRQKKIGGILIEKFDNKLLIGIGINLRHSPEGLNIPYRVSNVLQETGVLIDQDSLLEELSDYFDQFDKALIEFKPAHLRQMYRVLLEGQGQEIKVTTREKTLIGVLQDINKDGALVLNVGGLEKLIYAADIFFI